MINDTISDMLTRIRNACLTKKLTVLIPYTRMNQQISQILEKEGFIQTFQISDDSKNLILKLKYRSKQTLQGKRKESCITNLKRISKPGLRIYTNHKEIPRILGGAGRMEVGPCGWAVAKRAGESFTVKHAVGSGKAADLWY